MFVCDIFFDIEYLIEDGKDIILKLNFLYEFEEIEYGPNMINNSHFLFNIFLIIGNSLNNIEAKIKIITSLYLTLFALF